MDFPAVNKRFLQTLAINLDLLNVSDVFIRSVRKMHAEVFISCMSVHFTKKHDERPS